MLMKKLKKLKKLLNFQISLSPFWQTYLKVICAGLFLIFIGALILSSYLNAFEKSQSIYTAKESFAHYFEKGKYEKALQEAGYRAEETEDIKTVAKALKEAAKTKVFDLCAVKTEDGIATYHVVLTAPIYVKEAQGKENVGGDIKVAQMRFQKTRDKNFWGFESWEFLDMKFFFHGELSITCAIPSSYTLFANGTRITPDKITGQEEHPWNNHLPEGKDGISLNIYHLSEFFLEPDLSCQNEKGENVTLVKNEKEDRWEAVPSYEEVDESLKTRLIEGMKEYAKYNQKDVSLSALSPYFDPNGPFYEEITKNPYMKVWEHDNSQFKNEVIEKFYFFDQNTLCCHISFDQVLKKKGREDYIDSLDMTVFARKEGGTWLIYDHALR